MNESDESSVAQLKVDETDVRMQRTRLVAEKCALQAEVAKINAECKVRIPTERFRKLQSLRGQLVQQINEKEQEISALNGVRAGMLTVVQAREKRDFQPSDVKQLVELRDRWHAYSMDDENHQKSREAAWKFSQELKAILKSFFDRE